jgi:NTP pyrophosphatase (non-canonical NTP hydrolase)
MTLVSEILETSRQVDNGRTIQDVLTHAMTELGELAQEVQIAEGKSYKQQGVDGVVGEALDVINCMIDIIYIHYGVLADEHYLKALNSRKLAKWKEKAGV